MLFRQREDGCVDQVDESIDNYRTAIRSKKGYFPQFCERINVCVNNGWLFTHDGGKQPRYTSSY